MTRICDDATLMLGLHPLMLDLFREHGGGEKTATWDPSRLQRAKKRAGWVRTRATAGMFSTRWIFRSHEMFFRGKREPRARHVELLFVPF